MQPADTPATESYNTWQLHPALRQQADDRRQRYLSKKIYSSILVAFTFYCILLLFLLNVPALLRYLCVQLSAGYPSALNSQYPLLPLQKLLRKAIFE
jgi:hypothetical protein